MRAVLWIGVIVLVLGIASFFMAIPHKQQAGIRVGDASIGVAPCVLRHMPTASKFSSAKPRGSIREWQTEQEGFTRCWSILWRIVNILPSLPASSFKEGTSGGGGGGGVPIMFSSTHLPRIVGEVLLA